jgi:hypothetical protein
MKRIDTLGMTIVRAIIPTVVCCFAPEIVDSVSQDGHDLGAAANANS